MKGYIEEREQCVPLMNICDSLKSSINMDRKSD
jgi:hypothetical protein